jgi:hypothetical protein
MYNTYFKKISDLSNSECQAMAELYLSHYDACNEGQFFSDLNNKTEVLLVRSEERLIGFTTLQLFDWDWERRTIHIVYSGDTIVEPAHWGQQALAFAWIARMGELKRLKPKRPLYWFLIVKGHRTYRYLHTFAKSFYPHWSQERSDLAALADALARDKFGNEYNPKTGVVEFAQSKGHLKAEIAEATAEEQQKEAVKYFLKCNPNYRIGHELVCLCEIAEDNMKPLTRRIFIGDKSPTTNFSQRL